MTTQELIQQLQTFDPGTIVCVWDFGEGDLVAATNVEEYEGRVSIEYNRNAKEVS